MSGEHAGTAGVTPSERRADIQGLRALAVVLVVLFHAHLGFSGGFVGVDVFFVISGFVITALLLRELGATGTLSLTRFYLRRIRRLLPALGLLVAAVAVVAVVAAPVGIQPIAARTGAAAQVFLGNFYLYTSPRGYFALDANLNPFLHTWSLGVEEQFYLVFPVLLLGAWRLGRTPRRSRLWATVALTVVGLGSFAVAVAMTRSGSSFPGISSPRDFAFYSSPTRAWEFAAGALLTLAVPSVRRIPSGLASALGWIGVALVVGVSLRYDALTVFPGVNAIPPVLGTVLLLAAGVGSTRGVGRFLSTRPAVFVGDISYSWYLWHWPLIVFARATWPGSFSAPVAAAISIVPAWLSYRFVENPIRHSTRLTPSRTVLVGATAVVTGLAACGVLVVGYRAVVRTDGYASVRQALRTHRACPKGGEGRAPRTANDPEVAVRCTWSAPDATGTIVLAGDSNAGHIGEPVVAAARALHRSVYRATSNGCPFVDVTMVVLGERRNDCRRFFEASVREVERLRPDLVVIGSTTTRYLDEEQFGLVVGNGRTVESDHDGKARAWAEGMRRIVRRLSASGIPTLVVHPVPKYPGWDVRGCAAGRVVLDAFTCGRSKSRATAVRDGADALAAERSALRGIPAAHGIDLLSSLCSPSRCATDRNRVWLYHDGDHLSVRGADGLTSRFRATFSRLLDVSSG